MQKLWESTNQITKAQWPKAYQSKSPCPTLKAIQRESGSFGMGVGGMGWRSRWEVGLGSGGGVGPAIWVPEQKETEVETRGQRPNPGVGGVR